MFSAPHDCPARGPWKIQIRRFKNPGFIIHIDTSSATQTALAG